MLWLPPLCVCFVLVTALVGGRVESDVGRYLLGATICLGIPLLARAWLNSLLQKRGRRLRLNGRHFIAIGNLMMGLLFALGWADDSGRALRRRGDWFVGESNGAVARHVRGSVATLAGWLERFDPPADLAPIVIPPDPEKRPYGPFLPGTEPQEKPTELAWWHPLAGPRRAMPLYEARRFGASRPPPRPRECELGHCGVDLGSTLGEPVFAAQDGTIERIERDAERGGRAGRYIRIGHKNGTVVTRYIHLDSVRADLIEGQTVHGGDLIGRVGKTGVMYSGPHLHFGISLRPGGPGGDETYIDPEPLLRNWQLRDARELVAARDTIRR